LIRSIKFNIPVLKNAMTIIANIKTISRFLMISPTHLYYKPFHTTNKEKIKEFI